MPHSIICFLIKKKNYYLLLVVLGLCCCRRAFSSCSEVGLLFVLVLSLLIAGLLLLRSMGSRAQVQ